MRMSQLFNQTLREAPAEINLPGNTFLQRAGYIRQVGTNLFVLNPLGQRSLQKIISIVRQELAGLDGQEIKLPALISADVLLRNNAQSVLGIEIMDLSESSSHHLYYTNSSLFYVPDLIQHSIRSHRQLPRILYQIQPKMLPGRLNRAGLLSAREVTRLETFPLDKDPAAAGQHTQRLVQAFQNIMKRCTLPVSIVAFNYPSPYSQSGYEFIFLHPQGDTPLLHCPSCGILYPQASVTAKKQMPEPETLKPLEKVHTPHTKTIAELAAFLGVPAARTAKAVFLTATLFENGEKVEKVVMAILRGDMELNETKLRRAINAWSVRPSTDAEIQSIAAVPGFASPVGLKDALVVVDDLIPQTHNLVAGANEADYHLRNVNYGRDFQAKIVTDLTSVNAGDACPECHQALTNQSGFLLGRINAPSDSLSTNSACYFQDENGDQKPILVGSAWLDLERFLAVLAETSHDEFGLILPLTLSPYQVHLVVLPSKKSNQPIEFAETLYKDLQRARIEVLYDDRNESAGVKFNDADMLGCPIRITVAEKSLSQGQIEFKIRREQEKTSVPMEDALTHSMHTLLRLEREIAQSLVM